MVKLADWLYAGLAALAVFLMVGCAAPLKEVAFPIEDSKDGWHFVVNRDLQNDRFWGNQTQMNGEFHCTRKRTSEEVAELRRVNGPVQSWYAGCTPLRDHPQHQYAKMSSPGQAAFWGDAAKTVVWAGTVYASAREIGRGLAKSGTTVNQEGGGAQSEASARAEGGAASTMQNSGNKTTNIKPQTNINSGNKIITK